MSFSWFRETKDEDLEVKLFNFENKINSSFFGLFAVAMDQIGNRI